MTPLSTSVFTSAFVGCMRPLVWAAVVCLCSAVQAGPPGPQPGSGPGRSGSGPVSAASTWAAGNHAEREHARAVESFRQGRFPEAYGRFVALAEVGHPTSARYALWMCEHGPALFNKDWDCGPEQVQHWAQAAGIVAPHIGARLYAAPAAPATASPARVAARR